MGHLTAEVQTFIHRYRRALLTRLLLLAALGIGVLIAVGWRLRSVQGPLWLQAALWVMALAGGVGLGWWVRRRWLSPKASVRALDDAMGLEQRLITASEFEQSAQPPALYPLLLQDTMSRFSQFRRHLPRLMDRTTLALGIVLLLLLVWPIARKAPLQLAHRTETDTPQPPEPDEPPPPESQPQTAQQQDRQAGSSQDGQQASGQQQDASGSERGAQASQGDGEQSGSPQRSAQGQPGQGQEPQEGLQGESPEAEGKESGDRQMARDAARDAQRQDGQPQAQSDQQQGPSQRQQQADRSQQPSAQDDRGTQEDAQVRAASSKGGRAQQWDGDQEALRADIQQLLKELQEELSAMQQQLAARTTDQPHPQAGIGTDPDLYGDDTDMEPGTGPELPIQLKTDEARTSSRREGGGTGRPSGEVASAGPEALPESAVLSDEPLEETSVDRRAAPPEYQPVFDRLYQRTAE